MESHFEPITPDPVAEDERRRSEAREEFDRVTKDPESRAVLKSFLTERANAFLVQHQGAPIPRKKRRVAARALAKRMFKKVRKGEV